MDTSDFFLLLSLLAGTGGVGLMAVLFFKGTGTDGAERRTEFRRSGFGGKGL